MHVSIKRLADFVRSAPTPTGKPIRSFADIGTALGVSSSVVSNWKRRGLSKAGALKAEAVFGCPAGWLLNGGGIAPANAPSHDGVVSPPAPIGRRIFSTQAQRQIMNDLGDLLPDEGDALIRDLHIRAEEMRRHREYILQLVKLGP